MTTQIPRLCGEEWQRWANSLLTCHYGPTEYQRVQDNDKGDAGIEGFTITDGHAYQAYGCEEPISTSARYAKQRDKITTDIAKFIQNRNVLARIFGAVSITRWVLIVPYYDSKEIIAHAATKTVEVINARLPYVADSFRVFVSQEDDFAVERDRLINARLMTLRVDAAEATAEQVTEWAASNDVLSTTLDRKLRKLPTIHTEQERHSFHAMVLKWYLEGQEILQGLRKYPDIYEQVIKTKLHRENFLVMAAVGGSAAQEIFTSSVQALLDTLKNEVQGLHAFSAERLAYEAVADWLLRCPLDFPEIANA